MPQSTAFFKYKVCNLAHIFVKTYSLCGVLFNRFGVVPVYANKADIAEKNICTPQCSEIYLPITEKRCFT